MRFRPRFSLRTLFVLVTIAGVCAGWVAYQLNWIRAREAALKSADPNFWTPEFNTGYPPAPLSLRIFGVRGVAGLRVVYIDKQPLLKEKLVELFPEAIFLNSIPDTGAETSLIKINNASASGWIPSVKK